MPATISQPTRGRPAALPKSASEVAPTELAETLLTRFGYDQFVEGQQEVMTHLLAGRSAAAVFPTGGGKFLFHDDLNQLENFTFGDTPTGGAIERLVSILFVEGKKQEEFAANLHDLSGRCDIRPLVVRTLLVYLELDVMLHCVTHHTAHQIIDGWLGHAWPEWSNGLRRNSLHRSPSFVGIFPA